MVQCWPGHGYAHAGLGCVPTHLDAHALAAISDASASPVTEQTQGGFMHREENRQVATERVSQALSPSTLTLIHPLTSLC